MKKIVDIVRMVTFFVVAIFVAGCTVSQLESRLERRVHKKVSSLYEQGTIKIPEASMGKEKIARVIMEIHEDGQVKFFDEKENALETQRLPNDEQREIDGHNVIVIGKINPHYIYVGGHITFPPHKK